MEYKNGSYKTYYENGNKYLECNYIDGKKHGLLTVWYENGNKQMECNYIDSKKNGLLTVWYENGKKDYECNYVDDLRHGLYQDWYMNEQLKSVTTFQNGKVQGQLITYREDGSIIYEFLFENGEFVK